MRTKEQLEKENYSLKIAGAIIIIGLLLVCSILSIQYGKNNNVCYDFESLNKTLKDIQSNCDSTQIVQKWGNDEDWFVFQANICDGFKCESKYIPLNKCLN